MRSPHAPSNSPFGHARKREFGKGKGIEEKREQAIGKRGPDRLFFVCFAAIYSEGKYGGERHIFGFMIWGVVV